MSSPSEVPNDEPAYPPIADQVGGFYSTLVANDVQVSNDLGRAIIGRASPIRHRLKLSPSFILRMF
jgi:hypothetical protein